MKFVIALAAVLVLATGWLLLGRSGESAERHAPQSDHDAARLEDSVRRPAAPESELPADPERTDASPTAPGDEQAGGEATGNPADVPETPPRHVDISTVALADLIEALKIEANGIRHDCYEQALPENLALAAKLPEATRGQAEQAARELADAEFEMRTLRNRLVENRHVYNQPPTVKVEATPDKVWMGQNGTLKVGSSVANYFLSTEEYPELGKAIARWQRARGKFRGLTKP